MSVLGNCLHNFLDFYTLICISASFLPGAVKEEFHPPTHTFTHERDCEVTLYEVVPYETQST